MSIPVYTDKGRQYKGKEQPSNPASITANSGSDLENISTVTVNYLLDFFFIYYLWLKAVSSTVFRAASWYQK